MIWLGGFIKSFLLFSLETGGGAVENYGRTLLEKDIKGSGHKILINRGCYLNGVKIRIRGDNNSIVFGKGCCIGEGCSLWIEGNNSKIIIGENTTFTERCHLNAQEDSVSILIGGDCMFSNNVVVRTSDSHPIYDKNTNERVNFAKDVIIGNHVWIAPNTKIMKGAIIGDGCIIGSDTTVSKEIPPDSMAVGRPAKIVKTNIRWTREKLF